MGDAETDAPMVPDESRDLVALYIAEWLDGMTKAEQFDALEDLAGELAGELQVRADDLRAEMRAAPAEPGPDAEEGS